MENLPKLIIIPYDGSKNALNSLDYLGFIYGAKHNLKVILLYVLPSPPSILADDISIDKQNWARLTAVEKKHTIMAERMLAEARTMLVKKGFEEERIQTVFRKKEKGIARDICRFSQNKQADAVLITRRGRTKFEDFFMGEISSNLVEYCRTSPVWIIDGPPPETKALVCVDSSENALRAVDHAGFMLSGTECRITLFHTMRHLRRFVPLEALEAAPDLEKLWKKKEGQQLAPYMEKARNILLNAGLPEDRINTKIVEGSRSPADDILKEARDNNYGTIVLGRRGLTAVKGFFMGSVTSKILNRAVGLATWIIQ